MGQVASSTKSANDEKENIKFEDIQIYKDSPEIKSYTADYRKRFDLRWHNVTESTSTIADFKLMKTIGVGTFGKVILARTMEKKGSSGDRQVQEKEDNQFTPTPVAIKVLNKKKMVKLRQVDHVINEKKVLYSLNYHGFVKLYEIFKSPEDIYLVMNFVNGGELFTYIREKRCLPFEQAKFFFTQTVLAIEHLHMLDIVYRDLKPENILIDATNGYLKLTDFGFAKRMPANGRAWTLCGTPDYLAPEIILSKGYGKGVDFWALGILLYEMLMGFTPFYGEPAPMGTYKKIVNDSCKIQISRRFKERPYVKSLITSLLQRDWTKRIGILQNGVFDIVHHEFFGGMARERDDHWMRTLRKEYKSEYVPHVVDSFDSSLFQDI